MSIATYIANEFGNDGGVFEIDTLGGSLILEEYCEHMGASVEYGLSRYDYETEAEVVERVSRSSGFNHIRYVFPDGSAIVVAGDAWDVEGDTPFSWHG